MWSGGLGSSLGRKRGVSGVFVLSYVYVGGAKVLGFTSAVRHEILGL